MRVVAGFLAALAPLVVPDLAAADTCDPARAMVILDKSSSMVTGFIGNQTKWDVAVSGLSQVLTTYEAKAEFGLMTYPQPSQCGPGAVDVAPAMSNKSAILAALQTPPPNAGNWTPMAQTLLAAAQDPSLAAAAGTKHVILITDGWQWCSPYDPDTRFDGSDAVAQLEAAGVTTWVVGFGAEVDAAALNQMAVIAGTQKANCNQASSDPAAPDNCYFQADNAAELVQALTAISSTIVANEMCDGIDNDCDGQVDEDLKRDCSNGCGAGAETCTNGAWGGCDAPAPAAETCDGDDNDCDGQVDEPDNTSLCSGRDEVCEAGECQPGGGATDGGAEMQAGCACESSGPDAGALVMFLAVGLVIFGRRRATR